MGALPSEILLGKPPIRVRLRRNLRARRYILRLSTHGDGAFLTIPRTGTLEEGLAFVRAREDWLRERLGALPARRRIVPGCTLPVEGRTVRVELHPGPNIHLEDGRLLVGGDTALIGPRVAGFLRARARDIMVPEAFALAAQLGRVPESIRFRDTRSRWGSCSSEGRLMFSWRLVMVPARLRRYVVAHEVAHLVHMNHSHAFWHLVGDLHPGWQEDRKALRESAPFILGHDFGEGAAP